MDNEQIFNVWRQKLGLYAGLYEDNPDSFDGQVKFGTAGIRGIDGIGTNRINEYVIARAALGLSIMIKRQGGTSVGISFDNRKNSRTYARISAEIFAQNGIDVYITPDIMPTPYLAYCLKQLKLSAGVMVTASHNPKQYSGYKVYGNDACQISGDYAKTAWDIISSLDYFDITRLPYKKGVESGRIKNFPPMLLNGYMQCVSERFSGNLSDLKVCFTPLNGSGAVAVPKLLTDAGAEYTAVPEQVIPDPEFATCPYPNPEKAEAFNLARRYADSAGCDIILATDPDSDRIGAMYRTAGGDYKLLSGDEIGLLITHHVLKGMECLPAGSVIVRSIVTMSLCDDIARKFGVGVVETYTGFKNICTPALSFISGGTPERYILGYEESNGICVGTYALDKDGIMAAMLLADIAAKAKRADKTIADLLNDIYDEFGYMTSTLKTFQQEGRQGRARIAAAMKALRENSRDNICGYKVLRRRDFLQPQPGFSEVSDVYIIEMQDGIRLCMRPSGTEPLLKVYMQCRERSGEVFKKLTEYIDSIVNG